MKLKCRKWLLDWCKPLPAYLSYTYLTGLLTNNHDLARLTCYRPRSDKYRGCSIRLKHWIIRTSTVGLILYSAQIRHFHFKYALFLIEPDTERRFKFIVSYFVTPDLDIYESLYINVKCFQHHLFLIFCFFFQFIFLLLRSRIRRASNCELGLDVYRWIGYFSLSMIPRCGSNPAQYERNIYDSIEWSVVLSYHHGIMPGSLLKTKKLLCREKESNRRSFIPESNALHLDQIESDVMLWKAVVI